MTETQTVDLAAWLTRIWDEEEARELAKRTWRPEAPPMDVTTTHDGDGVYVSNPGSSVQHWLSTEDYDRTYLVPAPNPQVLARIAADRKILERIQRIAAMHKDGGPLGELAMVVEAKLMLYDLASPYKGREGWQEAWGDE